MYFQNQNPLLYIRTLNFNEREKCMKSLINYIKIVQINILIKKVSKAVINCTVNIETVHYGDIQTSNRKNELSNRSTRHHFILQRKPQYASKHLRLAKKELHII